MNNSTILQQGTLLHSNSYKIIRMIGQGGFGITYLAVHLRLKKQVAIKEFFPKSLCNRDYNTSQVRTATDANTELVHKLRKKFLKEAEHIAALDSPYIINITDVFEENGTAYYIMDYIEGNNLSEIVKTNGPLPEHKAFEYISKIGEALTYIHSKRMNHLDVKPANVMVRSKDNTPILIDFGLSKQYDSDGNQTSTTPVGISHGYAPMEQYNDGGVKEFSPQTDLYSLAATLYFILTGVVPPQATRLVDEELTFPSSISPTLIYSISKAMSSGRRKRHESISEFIKEINKVAHCKIEETQTEETNIKEGAFIDSSKYDSKDKVFHEEEETKKKLVNAKKWIPPIVFAVIAVVSVECLLPFISKCSQQNQIKNETKSLVRPEGRVSDINDYLTTKQRELLNNLNDSVSYARDLQIVSMIVKNSQTYEFKLYNDSIFNSWGIGDAFKNNGVLIGIDVDGKKIAITTGLGVPEANNEEISYWQTVVDSIQPYCKRGDYFNALKVGTLMIGRMKQTIDMQYLKKEPDGYINGYGYLDLGLPSGLKWAWCNLGSKYPYESGKKVYTWESNYNGNIVNVAGLNLESLKINKIISQNNILLEKYDIAYKVMGGLWRTPSKDEYKELIESCKWSEVIISGGEKVFVGIGPNGNTITFPIASYWSSSAADKGKAYSLIFTKHKPTIELDYRTYSFFIRPVLTIN